jgi:hypothetical protein
MAGGLAGDESVGEELVGFYVEAGYDVLAVLAPASTHALTPYARFESLDTQAEVPAGFTSDPANDLDIVTLGLNYRPLSSLVFKAEYQDFEDEDDGINVAMGFSF